jgi:hypothetical protein
MTDDETLPVPENFRRLVELDPPDTPDDRHDRQRRLHVPSGACPWECLGGARHDHEAHLRAARDQPAGSEARARVTCPGPLGGGTCDHPEVHPRPWPNEDTPLPELLWCAVAEINRLREDAVRLAHPERPVLVPLRAELARRAALATTRPTCQWRADGRQGLDDGEVGEACGDIAAAEVSNGPVSGGRTLLRRAVCPAHLAIAEGYGWHLLGTDESTPEPAPPQVPEGHMVMTWDPDVWDVHQLPRDRHVVDVPGYADPEVQAAAVLSRVFADLDADAAARLARWAAARWGPHQRRPPVLTPATRGEPR